jgi:hypothetical protein
MLEREVVMSESKCEQDLHIDPMDILQITSKPLRTESEKMREVNTHCTCGDIKSSDISYSTRISSQKQIQTPHQSCAMRLSSRHKSDNY